MQKFIHTVFVNTRYYFFHYILVCILISLIAYIISCKVKKKKIIFDKKIIFSILINSYFILPVWSAVFSRFKQPRQNPFANIFGGWGILEHQYTFDFSLFWNLLMFAPMFLCIYGFLKLRGKGIKTSKTALISILICFLYSGIIEILQIIFRIGTFQISDLVYNTLGGLIGAIVTLIIIKRRCH